MNQSATTTKRVFALAAALAVALACVFALTHTQAFAEDRSVSTWEEFVAAMGQADGDTITITSDIQATESIEVPKNVTIKGDSDNTIYRGPGLGGDPIFNVTSGSLTLGSGLTLSGQAEAGVCADPLEEAVSGNADSPNGLFVKVNEGGTLTLDGATLKDLITTGEVSHAAPVVVDGGTIDIKDGAITHNSVGYSANNADSNRPYDAWRDGIGGEQEMGNYQANGKLGEYKVTDTAGAIIMTNGAEGTFSGGKLSDNRGDTGAIVIQGAPDKQAATEEATKTSTLLIKDQALIDNNIGVHHSGGVYIFNGAKVQMEGGTISNNFAWGKGGAVWASEEPYASAYFDGRADHKTPETGEAAFIMKDGELTGNTAVGRGGAIEVMSNHVALLGGEITNNTSRVVGGGVYVEGDSFGNRLYSLYVSSGCITGNKAVTSGQPGRLANTLKLDTGDACNFENDMGTGAGYAGTATVDREKEGQGGGVWGCGYGGAFNFGDTQPNSLVVANNTAISEGASNRAKNYGADRGMGQDLYLDMLVSNSDTNGLYLTYPEPNIFQDERTGQTLPNELIESTTKRPEGAVAATNVATIQGCSGGITISGNEALQGGGIGSNGLVVFGRADTTRMEANLKVTKDWGGIPEEERGDVVLKLYMTDEAGTILDNPVDPLLDYSVTLNGKIDVPAGVRETYWHTDIRAIEERRWAQYENVPALERYNQYPTTNRAWEIEPWVANYNLQTSFKDNNGKYVSLFKVNTPQGVLDPYNLQDLDKIRKGIQDGTITQDNVEVAAVNFKVVEYYDGGEKEYVIPLNNLVEQLQLDFIQNIVIKDIDLDDTEVASFGVYTLDLDLTKEIGNDRAPETEKYVNKKVHDDIVYFDQEFDYDIMAYVPMDATEFTITDTPVAEIEFADQDGKPTNDGTKSVSRIATKNNNNHKPGDEGGSVNDDNEAAVDIITVTDNNARIENGGKLLRVVLEGEDLAAARGKWVQVTFKARIKDTYRSLDQLKGDTASWSETTEDKKGDKEPSAETYKTGQQIVRYTTGNGGTDVGNAGRTLYIEVKDWDTGKNIYYARGTYNSIDEQKRARGDGGWYRLDWDRYVLPDGSYHPSFNENGVVFIQASRLQGWQSVDGFPANDTNANDAPHLATFQQWLDEFEAEYLRPYKNVQPISDFIVVDADDNIIEGTVLELTDAEGTTFFSAPEAGEYTVEGETDPRTLSKDDVVVKKADGSTVIGKFRLYKNWPVLTDEEHEGALNNATYSGKFGNNHTFSYKTNTVTVKPETTKLTVEKKWNGATEWPADVENVTVGIFSKKGDEITPVKGTIATEGNDKGKYTPGGNAQATYVLTKDEASIEITDLPKLKDVTYFAMELKVDDAIVDVDEDKAHGLVKTNNAVEYAVSKSDSGDEDDGFKTTVNNEETGVEKYVNNDVHADLVEFDRVFKYDILAYVTDDAETVTITDPLVGSLEFADGTIDPEAAARASDDPSKVVTAVVAKDRNDHTVGSTVAGADEDNIGTDVRTAANVELADEGRTLKVTFDDAEAAGIQGKWVQVTFWAKYTQAVIDAAVVGDVDTVLNNGSVLEGITPHDGTTNEASYKITTKNGYEYDKTTNTVTVMPDTTWVEVGKEWMVRDKPADSWPEGAEVVVALTRNGEVVEGKTVTLTADSPTGAFMDLPRLIGVTYGVQEVSCSDPHYVLGKAQETEEGSGIFVITNTFAPDQPEVEKYVNNDVHADLVEFDRVFKYDILAYVTEDAKTMAIRDQLVPSLEFADGTLGAGVAAVASDDPAKVVTAVVVKDANDHKVGGTVAQPGTDVSASAAVAIKDNTLDVVFDDAKAAGIQGKWVQVTFWAKYTDAIIKAAEIGDVKKVVDNGAVLDGAAEHEGTFNGATYHIVAENDFDYGVTPTNEVTVVPETVTIPVKKVWKDYDGADLAWPSGVESIKVNVLGKDNAVADTITLTAAKPEGKSKVLPKLIGVEYKLEEATQIEGFETTFDGNTIINVKKDDRVDYSITKKWVGAKTSELPTPEQFKGFLILKDGDKDVTKDFAANLEVVDNGDFTYTATWSKLPAGGIYSAEESAIQGYTTTVEDSTIINTKTREEKPEIEKYINQDVHQLISLDDTFTYDIIAWVTKDADVVVIEDELDSVLAFAGAASDVVVTDLGERDNHNTNGDFTGKNENATVAAEGKTVNADVAIVGKRLTAAIADATPHRGHWVRVSFQAKVAEGKTLADVQKAYKEIKANAEEKRDPANVGNAPVLSTKDHEGVPNNAKYSIYLKHAKLDESGKPVRDESGNEITELDEKPTYGDESNTVTVRPVEEFEVLISKTDLGGTEVEGARIKVTDADGNVIDEWTSAADAHKFNLKPGRYTMVEVVAPEGFQQVTTEMVFEVDDRGNVTLITTEVDGEGALTVEGNHINLADAPEKVKTFPIKITKADIASGNELPGAHIQILDKDGNIVAEWDSTDTAHELQLEAGDYTMVEVNAPEGYKAVETRIQFSVNADGSVTVKNAEEVVDGKIEVKDVNHLVLSDMAETTLSAEASVVTKVWNDGGNAKDRKPVTFQLYYLVEGGTWTAMPGEQYTVTINEPDANGVWSTSFGDLPARVDGKDVQYKAVEANQTDFVGLYDMGEGDEEIVIVGTGNDNHGMSATNNPVFTGNYEVLISKRVLNTTTELEGATLQVLDASGQLVEGGEWVTDGKQKAFQLPVGLYTLHEKAAPKGYKLAADVQFRINANGTLEVCEDAQNDKWANVETGNPVVMYDAPEESENPNPVPNNQNPNTEKKAGASAVPRQAAAASTTPRATTTSSTLAKTSDDLGMVALALGAVTALALAAGAYSMRRRRSDV